jgi:D-alanyl-lipoteichoic acid acyltransferase DltB (MBOAT superfamily)
LLFNSIEFLVFLAVVLALYYRLGLRAQNRMLLVASYVFYAWWDWRFLSLLAISTVVDFFCAAAIEASEDRRTRRRLLLISIGTNLGILGFFKYFDFFVTSAVGLLESLGLNASAPVLRVILPVGISFYTFQTLGYTIDVYRGHTRRAHDFFDFALYVSFFPQLVAGPIERSTNLLPQISRVRRVDYSDFQAASQLLLFGYFKKVCIADGVAPYVDHAFSNPAALSSPELLLTTYLFAIQIYGDFSGYTDIARGVARLLGIRLTINFRQPYFSASITEFWQRWHVSLSSWLRDYLYIPLGGNRHGTRRTYRNLMLTMLLGGLWHGAAWHFVVWGGAHGLALALHRFATGHKVSAPLRTDRENSVRRALKILGTFHLVCLLWIFFRARDLDHALAYLTALGGSFAAPPFEFTYTAVVYLLLIVLIDLPSWQHGEEHPIPSDWPAWQLGAIYAAMITAISFIGAPNVRPFIYFQF